MDLNEIDFWSIWNLNFAILQDTQAVKIKFELDQK